MDTLRRTRPMMHGPAVARLQEMCDLLGYDLGPNDGVFGEDTEDVVRGVQEHLGLEMNGVCDPVTWAAIRAAVDKRFPPPDRAGRLVDIRDEHPAPKLFKCVRSPYVVDTIVLHQTGCAMPSTPGAWGKLNAHLGALREGPGVVVNGFMDWIWHAQGLSQRSIGVEIAGNFPGIVGDTRTLWKGGGGPHALTDQQVAMLNGPMLDWVEDECARLGIRILHIRAHRQSKDSRIADPGQEIWQRVAPVWAGRLGAAYQDVFRVGSGRPIPREWDVTQPSGYWAE